MNRRYLPIVTLLAATLFGPPLVQADDTRPDVTPQAWTFEEAYEQFRLHPHDVYLHYVTLQLARSEDEANAMAREIDQINGRGRRNRRRGRQVDLFAMFTGALAIQETLQLDTMRTDANQSGVTLGEDSVDLAELKGPTVKSHPWGKMLGAQLAVGKKPKVSPLTMCVPEDQYYVAFGSLKKLLEATEVGDLWGAHLLSQTAKSAKTQRTSRRLKTQLAVKTDPISRPFYDMAVEEVAITGSDLYFREGSDVTLIFRVKQPEVFKARMDAYLEAAAKSREDAVRSTGKIEGVDFVQVSTPDRAIAVFSAYPKPDLHVRSNSRAAMQRVLRAIAGRGDVGRLGESTEFKYIRTLMVRGDEKEDGFIYLSDPFIRRLVGPELKLTERRRMLCYNHLRMIGHASMLYRTQFGKQPESLEQLAQAGCAPGVFGRDKLRCCGGGSYELAADGASGVCSHHGHAAALVPCLEIPLEQVTEAEAKEYREFVEAYSRYWRRFFDPIAIRVQLTPKAYRAETIILPLIDNTVYTGLATALGGEPEPLDALPVPKRNIFSMALRVNKQTLLAKVQPMLGLSRMFFFRGQIPQPDPALTKRFVTQGIGNQIGMHVYDASPFFDFSLTGFLGEMLGSFRGGMGGFDDYLIPSSFLVASLNSPVYIAVPVQDAQIVDEFLAELDTVLVELARQTAQETFLFDFRSDFYKVPLGETDRPIRCATLSFGPIKWRVFFARIDDGLYIASKRCILEDLASGETESGQGGSPAHGMIRVRSEHWNEVLDTFQLGWAESSRMGCLNNLGPLSSVARAVAASGEGPVKAKTVRRQADRLHAVHFFCPDGGRYLVSADGKAVTCSVHGSAAAPKQLPAPAPNSPMGRLMKEFGGLTTELTFLEDGLHAVLTINRK